MMGLGSDARYTENHAPRQYSVEELRTAREQQVHDLEVGARNDYTERVAPYLAAHPGILLYVSLGERCALAAEQSVEPVVWSERDERHPDGAVRVAGWRVGDDEQQAAPTAGVIRALRTGYLVARTYADVAGPNASDIYSADYVNGVVRGQVARRDAAAVMQRRANLAARETLRREPCKAEVLDAREHAG